MKHFTTLLLILGLVACGKKSQASETNVVVPEKDTVVHHVTMLFAGDLMQHMPQVTAGLKSDGRYDFDDCFQFVAPIIQKADIAVGNFETTLGKEPYSGFPCFSSPDAFLFSVQKAGFDVMLTANNHCCDRKKLGIERTLHIMDSIQMTHLGTYVDTASRQKEYPLLIEKNGIRIVLLCATYGTNGIPVPKGCFVNSLDTMQLAADIEKAKRMKPDVLIATLHWGTEYQHQPHSGQKQLADWLLKRGVDHIIASHPHVLQPFEIRNKKHLVAYSLGNYVSNQKEPDRATGLMLQLHLQKDTTGTHLMEVTPQFTWVSRPAMSGKKQYYIYPLEIADSKLNQAEINFRKLVKGQLITDKMLAE